MGLFQVNKDAESTNEFPTFAPTVTKMRIKEVIDRIADGKHDWKIVLEYIDVTNLTKIDGSHFNGHAGAAGNLFDYVSQAPENQWKLRQLTEAAGLPWEDYDVVNVLPGKEVDVKLTLSEYQGAQRNKVGRYLKAA